MINIKRIMMKIKAFFKKNACEDCLYYNESTKRCVSKKMGTNGWGDVDWIDRHFCEPYKGFWRAKE